VSRVCYVSDTAQGELKSERVSAPASQPPRAHFPAAMAAFSSSYEVTSTMLESRNARASSSSAACTQGLTLVHFSAQTEPFLKQKLTLHTP